MRLLRHPHHPLLISPPHHPLLSPLLRHRLQLPEKQSTRPRMPEPRMDQAAMAKVAPCSPLPLHVVHVDGVVVEEEMAVHGAPEAPEAGVASRPLRLSPHHPVTREMTV